jgi:hypothetical protein
VKIIRDRLSADTIADLQLRLLVLQCIGQVEEQGVALAEVGHVVLIDPTDTLGLIELHLGVPVGSYELLEEHPTCLEVVYVLDQAGMGINMFIPKSMGLSGLLRKSGSN